MTPTVPLPPVSEDYDLLLLVLSFPRSFLSMKVVEAIQKPVTR